MIYKRKPKNFNPKYQVVSCFFELEGKILMLHRQDHKPEGNKWGLPAGKMDEGEKIIDSLLREVMEETGIKLNSKQIIYLDKVYVKYNDYHFVFYMYRSRFSQEPEITLNSNEHKNYQWINPSEAFNLNLVQDLSPCIDIYLKKNIHTI